jgi:hypothetical protein
VRFANCEATASACQELPPLPAVSGPARVSTRGSARTLHMLNSSRRPLLHSCNNIQTRRHRQCATLHVTQAFCICKHVPSACPCTRGLLSAGLLACPQGTAHTRCAHYIYSGICCCTHVSALGANATCTVARSMASKRFAACKTCPSAGPSCMACCQRACARVHVRRGQRTRGVHAVCYNEAGRQSQGNGGYHRQTVPLRSATPRASLDYANYSSVVCTLNVTKRPPLRLRGSSQARHHRPRAARG